MKIGVVAPGRSLDQATADRVRALCAADAPRAEIVFHPQCFLSSGHFAGADAARAEAFLEIANDDSFDALWVARGGYGSCRIAERVLAGLAPPARRKSYLGYSDAGMLLAGMYRQGFERLAHGPMPIDITRDGGAAAVKRALAWLIDCDPAALEPSITPSTRTAAFNLTILTHILGTPLQPGLDGHILMLEEVGEYMYRIDRAMFQLTSNAGMRRVAGIKLGRMSDIPINDPDFGMGEEAVVKHWCAASGIAYLGRADIGHDVNNCVVPFGKLAPAIT